MNKNNKTNENKNNEKEKTPEKTNKFVQEYQKAKEQLKEKGELLLKEIDEINRILRKKSKPFRKAIKWLLDRLWFYMIGIGVVIYLYFRIGIDRGYIVDIDFDKYTKIVTTILALISAVAFWLQFKRTALLNESNFVMNLNKHFIDSKDMTEVEHELELYYNQYLTCYYKDEKTKEERLSIDALKRVSLGLSQSRTSEDCQKLINYLAYLESIAIMVKNRVLRLDAIDDLFSYRFFIAVNNPVVQEGELLPYAEFYEGTYWLSQQWIEQHNENKTPIPMAEFCLTDKRRKEYKKLRDHLAVRETGKKETDIVLKGKDVDYRKIQLHCSFVRGDDDKEKIADCLYQTDRFIYPEAFGSDRDVAVKAISRLIGMDDSLFDNKNLFVARYNNEICGVALLYDGTTKWNRKKIEERISKVLPAGWEEGFNYASKGYFEKLCNKKIGKDTIEIVAFCVDEGFRNKGVGKEFMRNLLEFKKPVKPKDYEKHDDPDRPLLFDNKTFKLSVLEDNKNAMSLYDRCGFKINRTIHKSTNGLFEGFCPKGTRKKPLCYEMCFKNNKRNRKKYFSAD